MTGAAVLVSLLATAAAGARWLRVAQREPYLPGAVSRFALRWCRIGPNLLLAVGPFGLSVRGRTSPLAWTRRLRTLAAVWAGLHLLVVGAGALVGAAAPVAVLAAALTPLLVDAALALTAPLERRLVEPYVRRASLRLALVRPTVVAITGSYGKTSTKRYVAHLIQGTRSVVATPASFNNRAGLARAVNEHLASGTEVFVAEMGTYGRGEIAELCSWCRPDVAVITAIGPVHLERMGSEEVIAEAKSEILEPAGVAVLNVDHPLLEALAARRVGQGRRVVRCSAVSPAADVAVVDGKVLVRGAPLARADGLEVLPGNLACAVAVALELGVPEAEVAERLAGLPPVEHRLAVSRGTTGAVVVDDTYNSNPAGAAAALAALRRHASAGHLRVVVTPGMVELGPRQHQENARFAAAASAASSHLVVVGHTNRGALLEGARSGSAQVVLVETREQAVAWVRDHVGEGDVVLYENDLPDHFP